MLKKPSLGLGLVLFLVVNAGFITNLAFADLSDWANQLQEEEQQKQEQERYAESITTHESGTFLECLGTGVGPHESYSCERIALYMMGQCEISGQLDVWPCTSVAEYIQGHGLQNAPRLSNFEVAEYFRVIDRPETREEKTFTEQLMDDLVAAHENEDEDD